MFISPTRCTTAVPPLQIEINEISYSLKLESALIMLRDSEGNPFLNLDGPVIVNAWEAIRETLVNINNSESAQLLCHLHKIGATPIHVWYEVIKLECEQLGLGERFMELGGIIVE